MPEPKCLELLRYLVCKCVQTCFPILRAYRDRTIILLEREDIGAVRAEIVGEGALRRADLHGREAIGKGRSFG